MVKNNIVEGWHINDSPAWGAYELYNNQKTVFVVFMGNVRMVTELVRDRDFITKITSLLSCGKVDAFINFIERDKLRYHEVVCDEIKHLTHKANRYIIKG